jgi:hypothetical protein
MEGPNNNSPINTSNITLNSVMELTPKILSIKNYEIGVTLGTGKNYYKYIHYRIICKS